MRYTYARLSHASKCADTARTHTYERTHTQSHTHARTHTRKHIRKHTCTQRMPAYARTLTITHMHARTARTHTYAHARTHMHMHNPSVSHVLWNKKSIVLHRGLLQVPMRAVQAQLIIIASFSCVSFGSGRRLTTACAKRWVLWHAKSRS